jgi:translation initiation factor 4E
LCLIGEAFDDLTDDICGATINIRNKGDKLGLWTRDARRGDATVLIGYVF